MKPFKALSYSENEALLKFPALISMLAANRDDKLDAAEKESAIKFSHIKTYSCDPLLAEFYLESDKVFQINIEQLNKALPEDVINRDAALKDELRKLETLVLKLGEVYANVIHRSMNSFKEHVSKAHHRVLLDFIFPMPIKGLTY